MGIVCVVLLLSITSVSESIGSLVHTWVRPLWGDDKESLTFPKSDVIFMSKEELIKEHDLLKQDLYLMSLMVMDRTVLSQENAALQKMLGRTNRVTSVAATVLIGSEASPYLTTILDIGEKDGIKVGDRVSVANIGVGYISAVYAGTAKMILYSDSGNSVDVLLGDEYIPTVAHGRGGGNYIIELPRDLEVSIGDQVVSRYGEVRVIGIVEHIDTQPNDPFKRILFRSPVDMHRIRWVEVEKNENN